MTLLQLLFSFLQIGLLSICGASDYSGSGRRHAWLAEHA